MDRNNGDNLNWDFAPPDFSGEAFDPFAEAAMGGGELGQGPVSVDPKAAAGGTAPLRPAVAPRRNDLPQFAVDDPYQFVLENLRVGRRSKWALFADATGFAQCRGRGMVSRASDSTHP